MQLVPLDLEGDHRGHEVVNVRLGGDEHRQRVLAVVIPTPPPSRSLHRVPVQDVRAEHRAEPLRALAHDDPPASRDRRRQAPHGIEQGAHIGLRLGRERMKDRTHEKVRLDQRFDLDVARALQHGRVGADVELDGVLAAPTRGRA